MTQRQIERSILIEAPVERVWALVAQPGWWVADEGQFTDTVAVEGEVTVAKNAKYGEFFVRVEEVRPPVYLAYRWASAFPGEDVRDDNSTLIAFTLTAAGDSTHVQVVESGFDALAGSEQLRADAVRDNSQGWPECLDTLQRRAEHASA